MKIKPKRSNLAKNKSGYSGTSLARKLGIKEGYSIRLVDPPDYYFELFTDLPLELSILSEKKSKKNLIHYFTKSAIKLNADIVALRNEIEPNGMIWISWPKKASQVITDLNEDMIRAMALKSGLVDIKVCAVDEIWSGLKLVIPVKDRQL
jgi:hypothetical protein